MKPLILATALFVTLSMTACIQAVSTPDALAKSLQSALDKGDFDAARQLADMDSSPAEAHFFFLDTVRECMSEATCTVTTAAADDALRQRLKKQAEHLHAQVPAVDGQVNVALKYKNGTSGSMRMPYAKMGGEYKLTSIYFSPAEFSERKAKTDKALLEELFAEGVRDGQGELRTDWATAASKLPEDGGEPGRAYLAATKAMSDAVDTKDADAAMNSGDKVDAIVYRDKDFTGSSIPLIDRQRILQVQSVRMLRDVKVNGGYVLGDSAVLLIEARDGIGWIVRGPIILSRIESEWQGAGGNTVSYPAAK